VRHVGSAHDEAGLGLLMDQARQMLEDQSQGELELGVQVARTVARLVSPPGDAALFGSGLARPRRELVFPARVTRTCSRLLYDLLARVFDELGFDAVGDGCFKDLVVARVVEPTSLLDVDRVLAGLGRVSASLSTRKRTLRRCVKGGYREVVARACHAWASASGDVSLVLYDVTTLYFEAEREDELRRVGRSKERRVDPQVVVGLLVDRGGFPLEIAMFKGDRAETSTMLEVVGSFQARHGVEGVVVVADAGMLSAANLEELDAAGLGFVVGARQTKAPLDLESHYRWHGEVFADGQIVDTVTPRRRGAKKVNDPMTRAEPVWGAAATPGAWRAVWAFSRKRFAHDNKTLNAQEARARAAASGAKPARRPRFVKQSAEGVAVDEKTLARARRVAGLKGYVTNIPATTMSAQELIAAYHDLWQVEASFRMSKTDLRICSVYHHLCKRIEAYICIAFTVYCIYKELEMALYNYKSTLSLRTTAEITHNIYQLTFQLPESKCTKHQLLNNG
jgi:hypothetical protein